MVDGRITRADNPVVFRRAHRNRVYLRTQEAHDLNQMLLAFKDLMNSNVEKPPTH